MDQPLEIVVQKVRTAAALIGAVVLAAAGLASAGAGELAKTHILTVSLPDGSIEQVRYAGDRPPQISFGQAPDPFFSPGFDTVGLNSPFVALDRMSAEMDREAEALLNQTARWQASAFGFPDTFAAVDSGGLAPGARSFSVVSTLSGGHVCTRSVEAYASPDGGQPRIVTRTSGDCGGGHRSALSSGVQRRTEPNRARPGLIEVKAGPDDMLAPDATGDRIALGFR
jgi:hypothetical protein